MLAIVLSFATNKNNEELNRPGFVGGSRF